ncbi:MAG: single-stranded DNA-binding protein [Candidatus Dormibacteria bacterium]
MINTVEVAGTLTDDPDCRDLKSGALLVEFTVAVKGVRWDREAQCDVIESVFVRVQAWEDVAEVVAPLAKGTVVVVRGQLTQQEVTDSAGRKDRKTRVRALVVDVVRTPTGAGY